MVGGSDVVTDGLRSTTAADRYARGVMTPDLEGLEVVRDGGSCWVHLMTVSSVDALRGAVDGPYVGVVSADLGPETAAILEALRPGLDEIVCFDSLGEPVVSGSDFAWRALDELGFGQDFVFTVPSLEGAIDHAVDTLLQPRRGGWEGRSVVVVGPEPVVERAREHLTRERPTPPHEQPPGPPPGAPRP